MSKAEQIDRAKIVGKQPFKCTSGTKVRYTLSESEAQCRAKYLGWDVVAVDWDTYTTASTEKEIFVETLASYPFIIDAPVIVEYTAATVPKVTFAATETRLKVASGTTTDLFVAFCTAARQRLTLTQTLRGRLVQKDNELRLCLSKSNKEHVCTCVQVDGVLTVQE